MIQAAVLRIKERIGDQLGGTIIQAREDRPMVAAEMVRSS